MRIALARVLYIKPDVMLLDEPTNHLDLEACVWLEQYLSTYKRILVIISHSQDFLNGVCTNIIHMQQKKLNYYGVSIVKDIITGLFYNILLFYKLIFLKGNYDTYVQTRMELEENQMKRFKWEQGQMANMKVICIFR